MSEEPTPQTEEAPNTEEESNEDYNDDDAKVEEASTEAPKDNAEQEEKTSDEELAAVAALLDISATPSDAVVEPATEDAEVKPSTDDKNVTAIPAAPVDPDDEAGNPDSIVQAVFDDFLYEKKIFVRGRPAVVVGASYPLVFFHYEGMTQYKHRSFLYRPDVFTIRLGDRPSPEEIEKQRAEEFDEEDYYF